MTSKKFILDKFDQLKHDYFDRQIVQLTLDYFLTLESSTTNLTPSPDISNCQYKESPALRPNCSTIHRGNVVLNDGDVDVAFDNTVFVPSVNKSPNRDIEGNVYKFTYPFTSLKDILAHWHSVGCNHFNKSMVNISKILLHNSQQ